MIWSAPAAAVEGAIACRGFPRHRTSVTSRDEIGDLDARFNAWCGSSASRRGVRETFGKITSTADRGGTDRSGRNCLVQGRAPGDDGVLYRQKGFTSLSEGVTPVGWSVWSTNI